VTDQNSGRAQIDWRHTGRFCGGAFGLDLANGMFFVALPYLGLAFGADSMRLGILTALRGAAYILACVPASMLSDRLNRKALIAFSTVGICLAFLATAFTSEFSQLCVLTVFWALVISPMWPALFSWVGDSHSKEQLGVATGAVNLSWSVGGMLGGLVSGWLFGLSKPLPFLCAVLPAGLACALMLRFRCGHGRPEAVVRTAPVVGVKRELVSVWLSNMAVCSLLGLMSGVFPELGMTLGVNAAVFGFLMAGLALGRSVVFFLGLFWSQRLHDWRLAMPAQIFAGLMVASVGRTHSRIWLALVYLAVGLAVGINYYRGLYKSLEGAGSRGLKSGLHEATLLLGILLGSLGGGWLAKNHGLRAPYMPAGVFVIVLLVFQAALLISSGAARRKAAPVPPEDGAAGPEQE
jgi:MFS family permease